MKFFIYSPSLGIEKHTNSPQRNTFDQLMFTFNLLTHPLFLINRGYQLTEKFSIFAFMKAIYKSETLEIFSPDTSSLELPFVGGVVAGFPSPADDFVYESIDLNKMMVRHPEATFYARVKGQSMVSDFAEDDLLVIDRSLEWTDNKIALCYVNNEFTLKRLKVENGKCYLIPSNSEFPVMEVNDESEVVVWGIVTYSIKKH